MDDLAESEVLYKQKDTLFAHELSTLPDSFFNSIQTLSLDCFDTLLFRKVAAPIDVFYDLQDRPTFKKLGFTALMRHSSEVQARKIKVIQHYQNEVTLRDIYHATFPHLSEETNLLLEEEELAAEMEACYAFLPMIELMRKALAKKIQIIIVSDTYLKKTQLERLLAKHLPSDILKGIHSVFCSSEFGRTKGFGLFKIILEKLAVKPEQMFHLGDNQFADFYAPRREKISSSHFLHLDERFHELYRMQAMAAKIFNAEIHDTRPQYAPFKGFFTSKKFLGVPEEIIGYASLGPILYAFSHYVLKEIQELKQAGKKVKVAFLMRDAYLPLKACEQLLGEPFGKPVNISRFSSYAASFRTADDIDSYLMTILATERYADITRQLLMDEAFAKPLLESVQSAQDRQRTFIEGIHQPAIQAHIFKKSLAYYQRLKRHLEKELNLERGDTLVFIDLGYTGTTQKLLEPIFKKEWDVEVMGRYLISLNVPGWNTPARRGLLDGSWCDSRSLHAMILFITLFEQLCTSNGKSVMDYDAAGNPIFMESQINQEQQTKLEKVQTACLDFIREIEEFNKESHLTFSTEILAETAMAELGRLLFFPTETEMHYLESFQFETNLGTSDLHRVYDETAGLGSLRKRGIFSSYMEKHGKNMRTHISAEMRSAGLEHAIMLFTHHRFGLQFKKQDATLRKENIEVVVMQNNQGSHIVAEAIPTFDGFYAMVLPVGAGDFQLGILFGKKYTWVQFSSVERIEAHAYLDGKESLYSESYWDHVIFHQMMDQGKKLFSCQSKDSLMLIPAAARKENKKYLMRIVFRPIMEV